MNNGQEMYHRHLSGALDARADGSEFDELAKWLREQQANADDFVVMAAIDRGLRDYLVGRSQVAPAPPVLQPAARIAPRVASTTTSLINLSVPNVRSAWVWGAVVAAAATVALAVWLPTIDRYASIVEVDNAHLFTGEEVALEPIPTGQVYRLSEGVLRCDFDCGAQVVVEGPAEFEVTGEKAIALRLGRMMVLCATKETHGFVVELPKGRVVDLGTEFGIEVAASGESLVFVTEGEVQFFSGEARPPSSFVLRADEAMRVSQRNEPVVADKQLRKRFKAVVRLLSTSGK